MGPWRRRDRMMHHCPRHGERDAGSVPGVQWHYKSGTRCLRRLSRPPGNRTRTSVHSIGLSNQRFQRSRRRRWPCRCRDGSDHGRYRTSRAWASGRSRSALRARTETSGVQVCTPGRESAQPTRATSVPRSQGLSSMASRALACGYTPVTTTTVAESLQTVRRKNDCCDHPQSSRSHTALAPISFACVIPAQSSPFPEVVR